MDLISEEKEGEEENQWHNFASYNIIMESKHYKASSSGFIEVNEFNLPSMVSNRWRQSEEEIKKFELEEGLTELDKAKLLLKKKNTA